MTTVSSLPSTASSSLSPAPASGLTLAIIGSRGYPSTYGGYETLVRYLAPYMVAQGHHVTVYCREPKDGRRVWTEDGVRCIATRGKDNKQFSTLSFGGTSCVDAALRRYDAALVLNIANGYWMPLLRAARVPFAVNTDGLEWKRAKWSKLGKAVFKTGADLTAKFAPELVCDSRVLGDIWEEEFGRKSNFIPYGGEPQDSLPDNGVRSLGLEPGNYVLSVARLAPENNVELTLDAVERLGPDGPIGVVVGTANFDNPITDRLKKLEAEGRVKWLGHVSDQDLLASLWAHAGAYVHGHSVGGTNPALLQALAAGAPVLALETPFNREVLPYDEHLYPHDPVVLAERITALAAGNGKRSEFVTRGRSVIDGHYTWQSVCQAYTDLLVDLASGATRIAESRVVR